jgi:ribosomal protein S18 acetylase RimI-like enzyme
VAVEIERLIIRPATRADEDDIWQLFHSIVVKGEEFAFDPHLSKEEGTHFWCRLPEATFVAEENGVFLGSYYLRPNHHGPGGHVCNAGYMVCEDARGKGVATQMCHHSEEEARRRGYRAMVFNVVVSANQPAVHLWKKLGFSIVGEIPDAFQHPREGLVSTYVMHKYLITH